jgi:diguanylate cyclase (GGDEF)-like protein
MLSQKTALIAKRYYEEKDVELLTHLQSLYEVMQHDHQDLIDNHIDTQVVYNIYFETPYNLNKEVLYYLKLISTFITSQDEVLLTKIEQSSFALLPKLNFAVSAFEKESNQKTELLMQKELWILIGTLTTLLLEALFIVIPSIRIVRRKDEVLNALVKERTNELEKIAITDPLTKLYNRRKTDEVMQCELDKAKRYKNAFSVILIDIDHFKKINDTYGHQRGDVVLQTLSQLLLESVRSVDVVGRWGGEEFIIITMLPDEDKLMQFSEKLRQKIEFFSFEEVGSLTVSLGISIYEENDTEKSLIERVDKALYDAKNSGRNCVKLI